MGIALPEATRLVDRREPADRSASVNRRCFAADAVRSALAAGETGRLLHRRRAR
jgi:hypothetical protein